MPRRPFLALALTLCPLAWPGAARAQGGMDFAILVVRAADADRDGAVTRAEWQTFTAGALDGGGFDATLLKARVMASLLDSDRDGRATLDELAAELEREARGGFGNFGREFVEEAGDTNEDGRLSERERLDLLTGLGVEGPEPLPESSLVAWVGAVERRGRGDRSAMTPAVVLTSIGAALDATRDGRRTPEDLERLFARLDRDGDGAVRADELRPARAERGPREERGNLDEQRAKPCLMPWQRNLDDALALSRQRGQPLLICVNMDGEAASESLAWYRYRDPAFADLAAGFVCVIASPDTHNPRSHDDRGRRVPEVRFGDVLDSEHIRIEPEVYERYFGSQRVAPRHVGVSPAGEVLFDLYLLGDLSEIDQALETHGVRDATSRGELESSELLLSRDARDRRLLERRAVESGWRERFELAAGALSGAEGVQHPELVRLALRDPDERVRRQVLWTVARELPRLEPGLWDEALRVSSRDDTLHGVLLAAFARLARESEDADRAGAARRLLAIQTGLASPSVAVDLAAWLAALDGAEAAAGTQDSAADLDALSQQAAELEDELAGSPKDAQLLARQADCLLRLAQALLDSGQDPTFALTDARRAALAAEQAGQAGGRPAAVAAVASWLLREPDQVGWHAARALPGLLARATDPLVAQTLQALARSATGQVYASLGDGGAPAPADVADAWCAWQVLLAHPAGTAADANLALTFLSALGARAEQADFGARALARFADSADLHAWLRAQVLRDEGGAALEAFYGSLAGEHGGDPSFEWFRGVAGLAAAEAQVVNGDSAAATAAYGRALAALRTAASERPDYADSAHHYAALALAGSAREHLAAGRLDEALRDIRAALELRPESAQSPDGLGRSPGDAADRIRRALGAAGRESDAEALRAALRAQGEGPG